MSDEGQDVNQEMPLIVRLLFAAGIAGVGCLMMNMLGTEAGLWHGVGGILEKIGFLLIAISVGGVIILGIIGLLLDGGN